VLGLVPDDIEPAGVIRRCAFELSAFVAHFVTPPSNLSNLNTGRGRRSSTTFYFSRSDSTQDGPRPILNSRESA
jgi:hypothetical protein